MVYRPDIKLPRVTDITVGMLKKRNSFTFPKERVVHSKHVEIYNF